MKKDKYMHSLIEDNDKRFYSLNFLFAKALPHVKDSDNSAIITMEEYYKGKNIVIEKYYKNVSTIFTIPKENENIR